MRIAYCAVCGLDQGEIFFFLVLVVLLLALGFSYVSWCQLHCTSADLVGTTGGRMMGLGAPCKFKSSDILDWMLLFSQIPRAIAGGAVEVRRRVLINVCYGCNLWQFV